VLHTFQQGGFDAEETFDTQIRCHRCEAGDSVNANLLSTEPTVAPSSAEWASLGATALAASSAEDAKLSSLEKEVRRLSENEVFMKHEIEDLQLKLNRSESRALRGQRVEKEGGLVTTSAPTVPVTSAAPTQMPQRILQNVNQHSASSAPLQQSLTGAMHPAAKTKPASNVAGSMSAVAVQDPAIAASAEHAAQEAEKAAEEAERESQSLAGGPPPAKAADSSSEDAEDEKLVGLLEDGDGAD